MSHQRSKKDNELKWSRRALLRTVSGGLTAGAVGLLTAGHQRSEGRVEGLACDQLPPAEFGPRPRHRLYAGTQQGPTTPEMLRYFRRCGVTHICGYPLDTSNKGFYSADDIRRIQVMCEREGIHLAMIPLPFLTSSHVDREKRAAIVLGQSPERERDLEDIVRTLASCAEVGVPAVKYNLSLLGVMRTSETLGRGGAQYSSYRLVDRSNRGQLTRAGVVTAETFWARIEWFLSRIVPVAERLKIKMACHPHDPGTPPGGLHGIDNVLGTPAGLLRFLSICESPFHGLNLCIGTTAEMLEDPKIQLPKFVEELAKKGRIFNIHYRNIRGRRDDFAEVFVDEGEIDMPSIARILANHGYEGMLMPDHVPSHDSDVGSMQGFAYAMGYIKGVLQSI